MKKRSLRSRHTSVEISVNKTVFGHIRKGAFVLNEGDVITMSDVKNTSGMDILRDVLFPACAIFCALVFCFYLGMHWAGINVTEGETERVTIYDSVTDKSTVDFTTPDPQALPLQTLFGLLLFAVSLMLLKWLFTLEYSKLLLRFAHFLLTLLSFFVFVLAMPGYVTEQGAPVAMLAVLGVAVVYFVVWGIWFIIKRQIVETSAELLERCKTLISPVFAVFTLLVMGISIFSLISQVHVVVTEILDETFIQDDVIQTTYVRVVTPLAPTLQNYVRYLITGVVVMLGYTVLKLDINRPLKVLLNFVIYTAGYLGIWVIGMDYFRLVPSNALPAVIIYLSVYLAMLITVAVILAVRRRKLDDEEDYDAQFAIGSKRNSPSDKNR